MTCERCGRCRDGDFANCKNLRRLSEAIKDALPFVAYAYSKGIDGAEQAGRAIESALVRTVCGAELEPAGWQYRVTAGPQTGWSLWGEGRGEKFEKHYTVERRQVFAIKVPEARTDA